MLFVTPTGFLVGNKSKFYSSGFPNPADPVSIPIYYIVFYGSFKHISFHILELVRNLKM